MSHPNLHRRALYHHSLSIDTPSIHTPSMVTPSMVTPSIVASVQRASRLLLFLDQISFSDAGVGEIVLDNFNTASVMEVTWPIFKTV